MLLFILIYFDFVESLATCRPKLGRIMESTK